MPASPHRLKIIWIHGVVANAAGFGVLSGLIVLASEVATWKTIPDEATYGLFFLLELGCLVLLGYTQQRIMQFGGLFAPYWIAASLGGFVSGYLIALFVGGVCFIVLGGLLGWDSAAAIAAFVGIFTFGAGFGGMQTAGFSLSRNQRLIWMIGNGLTPFAMAITVPIVGITLHVQSVPLIGTLIGGTYGLMTATFLLWLLPTTAQIQEDEERAALIAAGERRYDIEVSRLRK